MIIRKSSVCKVVVLSLLLMLVLPQIFVDAPGVEPTISASAIPHRIQKKLKEKKGAHNRKKQLKETRESKPQELPPIRSWVNPNVRPSLCLLCIHGLGLHSGSFAFFGKEAANRGIAVYAMDVRGFGAWMKAEGKTEVDFDKCLVDVKQTILALKQKHPNLPIYLLGESMGGAIALRAASLYPEIIDGLISSVPAEERFKQKRTNLKVAANVLRRPRKKQDIGNSIVDQATTDERLRQEWKGDPLSRMDLSTKELIQFQSFMNDNHDSAKHVKYLPVLFVQGTKDKLVKPEGTWELFNQLVTKDKVFLAIPGEHLIFEEAQLRDPEERKQSLRMVAAWMISKLGWRQRQQTRRTPQSVKVNQSNRMSPREKLKQRRQQRRARMRGAN